LLYAWIGVVIDGQLIHRDLLPFENAAQAARRPVGTFAQRTGRLAAMG
jgi:hypothetical protein